MSTQQTAQASTANASTGTGASDTPQQPPAVVERLPQRQVIVVESAIPVLDTAMFEHMQRIATMMASSNLVPEHLNKVMKVKGEDIQLSPKEAVANCFLVTNQAIRWRMDPFAVAQHTFVTKGKVGYEGKMIAAVINTHPGIEQRLSYSYSGSGKDRKVVVSAKRKGDAEPRTVEGCVKDWETTGSGSPWGNARQHDQMLSYRGAREWARRWLPEAVLGVWGDDELEMFENTERTVAGEHPAPTATRGAAGLSAALKSQAATATDASVVDAAASKPAAAEKTSEKKEKPAGTVEQRDDVVRQMKGCADAEVLALARDLANEYAWTAPDQQVIDDAYNARRKELEG
jgi:hypothetical protein